MKKTILNLGCYTLVLLSSISFAQSKQSEYKIADKIHVEGDGGWDLLAMDETSGRLFLSHETMVQVIDVNTKKVVGMIPNTKGVHGIALAQDLNKGFTSNGKDSSVTIFNLKTLSIITNIKVTGAKPDAIVYDLFTHKVFVYNGKSANATVIDANTNAVIGTIILPGSPELSVSDNKGKVYVNIDDKSTVCVLNSSTQKIENSWSIAPGEGPSGIALDNTNHRLFIVCDNKLMVIMNAENGKVITTLPIGDRVDGDAFDPEKKRAYSSNGEGTITVVQEDNENTFKVVENVITQKGARTIVADTKTHHLYLPTAEYGSTPAPTKENPNPKPTIKPNTFVVLDVQPLN